MKFLNTQPEILVDKMKSRGPVKHLEGVVELTNVEYVLYFYQEKKQWTIHRLFEMLIDDELVNCIQSTPYIFLQPKNTSIYA